MHDHHPSLIVAYCDHLFCAANSSLRSLNLSANNIGDRGAKVLAEALKVELIHCFEGIFIRETQGGPIESWKALKQTGQCKSLSLLSNLQPL